MAEAGVDLPLTKGLPSPWNGQGLMNVQSLWTANPGATGTITLRSGIGMSGTLGRELQPSPGVDHGTQRHVAPWAGLS